MAARRTERAAGPDESLLRVSAKGVVSIPKSLRGDTPLYSAFRRPDGVIELHPKRLIDESQSWFWSERWQRMEMEAQRDIDSGSVSYYENADDMLTDLNKSASRRRRSEA